VSALAHGRHFWASEINPAYVELATTRLAQARSSLESGTTALF
jgi:hypothetical protein